VGDHHGQKEEEIHDPKDVAANRSEELFCHRDEARVLRHPKAYFNEQKSCAEHKEPADEVDEGRGDEAAGARCDRQREHADSNGSPCDEESSSDYVAHGMDDAHTILLYKKRAILHLLEKKMKLKKGGFSYLIYPLRNLKRGR
jgi:hypothetical protein